MRYILSIILFFVFISIGKSQITFQSPVNNSRYNNPKTNIIIKFNDSIQSINNIKNSFSIENKNGELLQFSIKLLNNNKTLLIYPKQAFNLGDHVKVILNKPIEQKNGFIIQPFTSSFSISRKIVPANNSDTIFNERSFKVNSTDLPDNFPKFELKTANSQSKGKIFFYNLSRLASESNRYLSIMDSTGSLIYWKQESNKGLNFTLQPSGYLSYWNENNFFLMDSSYNIIDTIGCGNGYTADWHEFIHLENHHSLLFAYDNQYIDMSQVIEGGDTNALVEGAVIQELDENKNVIFQWRTWDHFEITDASGLDFTVSIIPYVHANALELDKDSNILLSSRLIDEITKIDRKTGDIIWRLGGKKNQFAFINDTEMFCRQHDIRRIKNGNITLFDNGECHNPPLSIVKEYKLDEENKTAELVWYLENPKNAYCGLMGNAQRLPNGNTFINWGLTSVTGSQNITEVTPNKEIVFELTFDESFVILYRAHKYDWDNDFIWTSIKDYKNTILGDVNIYPNPVNDILTIKFSDNLFQNASLKLFDNSGKLFLNKEIKKEDFQIEFNEFPVGTYYLIIYKDDFYISKKIIKI